MSADPTPPVPTAIDTRTRWQRYGPWVRAAVMALLPIATAFAGSQGCPKTVVETIEKPVEILVPQLGEAEGLALPVNGWQPDAQAADRDATDADFRTFADTPAGQVAADEIPKQVFLWQAETKLTGKPTALKDQNPTGSCVGFGTTTAVERTLAADIVHRGGQASELAHFSEEVTYAGSKVQGAKALGARPDSRDGSSGVFAKKWVTEIGGMVPKAKYPTIDLTSYDAARAHSWNVSGCPSALVPTAKKFPVKSAAKVTNWQQAKTALASGYGVSICATWSYARQRDANGVAAVTREGWNHCMCLDGYYSDPASGKEYGHIENSWSNLPDGRGNRTGQSYHTGPVGWGNPTTAGFWCTSDSIEKAVKQGDSYAYSGATGFPARNLKLDWNVRAQPRKPLTDVFAMKRDGFALAW